MITGLKYFLARNFALVGIVCVMAFLFGPNGFVNLGALIVFAAAAVMARAVRKQDTWQQAILRSHQFLLDEMRNPAEEAAVECGTKHPTMLQMAELLGKRRLSPSLRTLGNAHLLEQEYDRAFPSEYRLTFRHDLGSPAQTHVIPYGQIRRQKSLDGYPRVQFPSLACINGEVTYGDRAVIYE